MRFFITTLQDQNIRPCSRAQFHKETTMNTKIRKNTASRCVLMPTLKLNGKR